MGLDCTLDNMLEKAQKAFNDKLPFVIYRNSESNLVKGIFQRNNSLYYAKDYRESGFVFAPFDNRDPSILFPLSESLLYSSKFLGTPTEGGMDNGRLEPNSESSRAEHMALVKDGIEFLGNNKFKKVVLSRKETVKLGEFKIIETYKKLLNNYNNAFAYCWFHPEVGLWLGATPETLLVVNENTFSTMALAGTMVYDSNKETNWQAKEKEEQQYVTDFILEQLGSDLMVSKPYTVKTGNLLHLRTDIKGQITKNLTLTRIINLLHPTPAVCGVPKIEAKDYILQKENYRRQFYTGFLGELNFDNTSNLFVNLRCMQVLKKHIEIYVGGGITTESIPESEWEETVAKSKVLLRILQ